VFFSEHSVIPSEWNTNSQSNWKLRAHYPRAANAYRSWLVTHWKSHSTPSWCISYCT